jgi:hypothetical protein
MAQDSSCRDEEALVRAIAEHAARAESLAKHGALRESECRGICDELYVSHQLERVGEIAERMRGLPEVPVEPLDVSATRLALAKIDHYLERAHPENYAGFRFAAGDALIEFGFISDLRRRVAEARTSVAYPARVSGFAA